MRWLRGLQAVQLQDGSTITEPGRTPRADLWRMAHSLQSSRLYESGCWFHVLIAVPQTPCPVGPQCFCFHEWVNLNMWWYWFSLDYFQQEVIKNLDSNELEKISSLSCHEAGSKSSKGWLVDLASLCSSAQVTSSPVIGKIGSDSLKTEKIFPTSHPAHFLLATLRVGAQEKAIPQAPSGAGAGTAGRRHLATRQWPSQEEERSWCQHKTKIILLTRCRLIIIMEYKLMKTFYEFWNICKEAKSNTRQKQVLWCLWILDYNNSSKCDMSLAIDYSSITRKIHSLWIQGSL